MKSDPESGTDLWVVPMVGERTPWAIVETPFREAYGAFSPDGRWVAFHSDASGQPEIYVRPFVAPGGTASAMQWHVSTGGGIMPVWRRDGRDKLWLYYLNPVGEMMAAPITVRGATFEAGKPVTLFQTRIVGGGVDAQQGRQYDVARDGRFLINTELEAEPTPITLLQNWNSQSAR